MNTHASPTVQPETQGAKTAPLLLLPGTVCDARLFAPMMEALAYPDMRVMPMSGATTTSAMAAKLLAMAPERFALLGFSLGGIVALEMVAQASHRITRLALVDTTPRPDPEGNAQVRRAAVVKARTEGMDGYILETWAKLVSPANAANESLRDTILAMARDAGADVLADQSEIAIHRADSRRRLGAIAVPTLILAGEDEAVCPLAAHEELAIGIPGARYFTIPRAGHFAPLENPAALARHISGWLGEENQHRPQRPNTEEPR